MPKKKTGPIGIGKRGVATDKKSVAVAKRKKARKRKGGRPTVAAARSTRNAKTKRKAKSVKVAERIAITEAVLRTGSAALIPDRIVSMLGPGQGFSATERATVQAQCIAFRQLGEPIDEVCRMVGIWTSTLKLWRGVDAAFNQAWLDATKYSTSVLAAELYRRAFDGVSEDVFDRKTGTVKIGERIKKSDVLLIAALKKNDPDWRRALSMAALTTDGDIPLKVRVSLAPVEPEALPPIIATKLISDGSD